MELKEGMYVRNELYGIGRVTKVCKCEQCKERGFYEPYLEFAKDYDYVSTYNYMQTYEGKASYNIIDLIETGDYVNGYKVLKVNINKEKNTWTIILDNEIPRFLIADDISSVNPIKSIVTKEQFESMSYKVGEE